MENVQYHTTIYRRYKQYIAFKILFNRFFPVVISMHVAAESFPKT